MVESHTETIIMISLIIYRKLKGERDGLVSRAFWAFKSTCTESVDL